MKYVSILYYNISGYFFLWHTFVKVVLATLFLKGLMYLYALECVNDKYYVGKTHNPKMRLEDHYNHRGSKWTQLHHPISVCEILEESTGFDEDTLTLNYMKKYGIENVRGGSFCQIRLSITTIRVINQMIRSSTNACFRCGKQGHFANACHQATKTKSLKLPADVNRFNLDKQIDKPTVHTFKEIDDKWEIIELNDESFNEVSEEISREASEETFEEVSQNNASSASNAELSKKIKSTLFDLFADIIITTVSNLADTTFR